MALYSPWTVMGPAGALADEEEEELTAGSAEDEEGAGVPEAEEDDGLVFDAALSFEEEGAEEAAEPEALASAELPGA